MQPQVTIITPVYNCERYIKQTVESVLNQRYLNISYFVIDDGSTDNTYNFLGEYNDKICIIHQDNAGEQKAVNRGLERIQGDYFIIVNADDPILPECISTLVDFMEENPEILCAYPDWRMIDSVGNIIKHMQTPYYDFKFMVRHHWCQPSVGAMFRASVLKTVGYRDDRFRWVGDFDYWLRVGLAGPMARLPLELACWRRIDEQKSGDSNPLRASERLVLMDKFYSLPNIPPEIMKLKNEAYSWACLVAVSLSATTTDKAYYAGRALRYYPWHLFKIDFWYSMFKYFRYFLSRYWG